MIGRDLVNELGRVMESGIGIMGTMNWGNSCAVLLETAPEEKPKGTHIHYFTLVLKTSEGVIMTLLLSREGIKKTMVRIAEIDIPKERSILFDNFYRELNTAKEWAIDKIEKLN